MRDKLNSNPLYQAGLIGILLLVAGIFLLSTMGGSEEEEEGSVATTSEVVSEVGVPAVAPPPGALAASAPPPPAPVLEAFAANRTVVFLFVRDGGIDDRMVAADVARLSSLPDVSTFVVPAAQISRYSAVAQGVDINRVPALVVLTPKHLDNGVTTASVQYGYQSPESVVQAVEDAGYKGKTLPYHP